MAATQVSGTSLIPSATMTNYKVVSELRTHGQLIDIPEQAHNVTVEPGPRGGLVRVTYLKHLKEIPFGPDADEVRPISH